MIYDPAYVKNLLKKEMEGTASPSETATLLQAMEIYSEEELGDMFSEIDPSIIDEHFRQRNPSPQCYEELQRRLQHQDETRKANRRRRIRAAAFRFLSLVAIGVIVLLWMLRHPAKVYEYVCHDQRPGTEIPTAPYRLQIRLASDAVHTIDSPGLGRVVQDGPLQISTPEPGLVVYSYTPGAQQRMGGPALYHTLATTTGGQYRVVLPDGSTVRLNAASALRLPLSFSDTSRRVELRGEALFEVVPHRQPFVVHTAGAEFRTAESRFNVKAYTPAAIATLLDGNLEVKTARDYLLLEGGEQAIIETVPGSQAVGRLLRRTADTAQAVSWKTVQRFYTNAPLREIVADMARWYNLRISNLACVPEGSGSAGICYNAPLESVYQLFREMGLRFVAKGNSITFCNPPPAAEGMALLKREKAVGTRRGEE